MKNFKDFTLAPAEQSFVGDKIKMSKILNKEIVVLDYKSTDSNYSDKGSGKCLHMQIQVDKEKRVVFTGSKKLLESIVQIPKSDLPFTTTIIETDNEAFQFT